ncbi:ATP-binding cassette domain-containing protein [Rhizobium rhizogenes]
MMETRPALELHAISRRYGGNPALNDISFNIGYGEVVGLIGENGAGKSTLLDIISGVLSPSSGHLSRNGVPIAPRTYKEANRFGIFRVFQGSTTLANLPVYANIFFGWERLFARPFGWIEWGKLKAAARAALDDAGMQDLDIAASVGTLSRGERQGLDIVRATTLPRYLGIDRPLVLFDEPTTALDEVHERNFLAMVERLRHQATIVLVSHRLEELLQVCDRLIVLKDGQVVSDGRAADHNESSLHHAMVGRKRVTNYYRENEQQPLAADAAVRVELEGISVPGALDNISLTLREGEVLGVAGIDGSGKKELGAAIAGAITTLRGQIRVDGARLRAGSRAAVAAGVAYVPRDRIGEGLIGPASLVENIGLPSWHDKLGAPFWTLRSKKARAVAKMHRDRMEIVAPHGVDSRISTLSGGNQQKVLIAKWIYREPRVLVLDGPTQGVDSGAREAIYRVIRDLSRRGLAIVLVGDDLPEVIGLSHRVLVLTSGRVCAVIDSALEGKPSEAKLVSLMIPSQDLTLKVAI